MKVIFFKSSQSHLKYTHIKQNEKIPFKNEQVPNLRLRAILLIIVYTDMSYVVGPNADIKDPLPVLIQTPSSRGWGML